MLRKVRIVILIIFISSQISLFSQFNSYPFSEVSLETLEDFANVTESWIKVKDVYFDLNGEGEMVIEEGTGVLLNTRGEKWVSNLLTNFEHEDIEIELDFMMAKGSNAGIFLQGRYEIQMYDSWLETTPQHSDNGGIYQRWNENAAKGKKGFHGNPPIINASKAPGLWQNLRILFQAPRFDEAGNKIKNGVFREVYLNEVLVQNNIEVTGPTRDAKFKEESSFGPIMFQGDHGIFALKNIKYKLYQSENITLTDMVLSSYDSIASIRDFDTRPELYQRNIDLLDHSVPSKVDDFGGVIKGKIHVPKSGDYYFNLMLAWIPDDGPDGPNGGGQLVIGDTCVISMDGSRRNGYGTINLEPGSYDLNLKYYKSFRYGYAYKNDLLLGVEGPQISFSHLNAPVNFNVDHSYNKIIRKSKGEIVTQRGFYNDEGDVKTHAVAVGFPGGVSYSYDLDEGKLLSVWHGGFINATGMWNHRGSTQLMIPNGSVIGLDLVGTFRKKSDIASNQTMDEVNVPDYLGYKVGTDDLPIYKYAMDEGILFDRIRYLEKGRGLRREIVFENYPDNQHFDFMITSQKSFKKLPNGLYMVGDKDYYIQFDNGIVPKLMEKNNGTVEVILPTNSSDEGEKVVGYSIIW
ncbi:DUF1080 domain-containing protein [Membranicola marinus]|uniref:DUF1080 domain-containing protein n=1 Tax=Membranihabitans marinus TaxID=1227546 RepID=A0A953I2P7_9BACT|nr:DUF1080 domain-containing protein [Membranihabitans marinus]MBY5960137.1 DUF1080 domain-containing protein [Membranihabitans marinus]